MKRILLEHDSEPAPDRSKTTSWASFLAAHWGVSTAADFLTVEVLTMAGLVHHQVLVVSRPTSPWARWWVPNSGGCPLSGSQSR